jgi:hypothetical protein
MLVVCYLVFVCSLGLLDFRDKYQLRGRPLARSDTHVLLELPAYLRPTDFISLNQTSLLGSFTGVRGIYSFVLFTLIFHC